MVFTLTSCSKGRSTREKKKREIVCLIYPTIKTKRCVFEWKQLMTDMCAKNYFGEVSWGTDTPSKEVNGGTDDEDSLGVDALYLGNARPNRVSIPTSEDWEWRMDEDRFTFECRLS